MGYGKGAERAARYDEVPLHERELPLLKAGAVILHPFPRRDEICAEIDADPRPLLAPDAQRMWIRAR